MDEIIKMQAEIYRTFGNPHRLKVIRMLCEKEMNAGQLIEKTGLSKACLSQHMGLLTLKGVVDSRKSGKNVYYRISDERTAKACLIMKELVVARVDKQNKAVKRAQ